MAHDGLQQRPDIHARSAETLMAGVRRGAQLIEILREGRAQGAVGVGVACFTAYPIAQNLFGGCVNRCPVALRCTRASGHSGSQGAAFVDQALMPRPDLNRGADGVFERGWRHDKGPRVTLALFGRTLEILNQSSSKLAALTVYLVNQRPAEISPEIPDEGGVCHSGHRAVRRLEGIFGYVWVLGPAQRKVLHQWIFPDREQLALESGPSFGGRGKQAASPLVKSANLAEFDRLYLFLLDYSRLHLFSVVALRLIIDIPNHSCKVLRCPESRSRLLAC
jgi:hypothetical protein